jgi:cytochrome P450
MEQYFLRTLEERHHQETEGNLDPISLLVHGCPADGVPLTQEEQLGNCEALPIVGTEGTANLITNLFRVLVAFPHVQQQVWENPDLVPALIEETLRYYSPLHLIPYRALRQVELGGKLIPENQIILALLSSANRDEEVFADPDSFDLMRFTTHTPNHVSFGYRGAHFCLGAPLARMETTLLMQRLIARVEHIRLVPGTSLKPLHVPIGMIPMYSGIQSFPITFQRRGSF